LHERAHATDATVASGALHQKHPRMQQKHAPDTQPIVVIEVRTTQDIPEYAGCNRDAARVIEIERAETALAVTAS
jgi:hypothetical protein